MEEPNVEKVLIDAATLRMIAEWLTEAGAYLDDRADDTGPPASLTDRGRTLLQQVRAAGTGPGASELQGRQAEPHGGEAEPTTGAALQYVNAYSVSRHYGGPEEGGWWYDVGVPLASIPVEDTEDVEAHRDRLVRLLGWPKQPSQGRFSVNGGDDFEVVVEDHVAEPWPKERPHYE